MAVSIVAGLLSFACTNPPASAASSSTPTSKVAAQRMRLCGAWTAPTNVFARVHGFITYNNGSEIWAVDPKHPASRVSLGASNGLTSMAWSRDGTRLLVTEQSGGGDETTRDLCVMNADGSLTQLTKDGLSGDGSFSPDGTRIVYARQDDGLYVIDATGSKPRLIAKSYEPWWLESPAWSPDGSRIAYMVWLAGGPEGQTYQIWTVNPDGTDPRPLVDLGQCEGGGCSGGLTWSPDGSMLAFHSRQDSLPSRTPAIYVVNADGSHLHRINVSGYQASWSPDGSRLAFTRQFAADQARPDSGLYTMATDGSDVTLVVEDAVPVPQTCCVERPSGLAWNPVRP
jgi:Tol biopolymer transport system component